MFCENGIISRCLFILEGWQILAGGRAATPPVSVIVAAHPEGVPDNSQLIVYKIVKSNLQFCHPSRMQEIIVKFIPLCAIIPIPWKTAKNLFQCHSNGWNIIDLCAWTSRWGDSLIMIPYFSAIRLQPDGGWRRLNEAVSTAFKCRNLLKQFGLRACLELRLESQG
jgi:hypothetical protein